MTSFEGALYEGSAVINAKKIMHKKPMCISDRQRVMFSGTDDFYTKQILKPALSVKKCEGDNCASSKEIEKFLANKYLQMTVISESYDTTNYDREQKVKKIAQDYWIFL